jgi:hypothetical protein
MARSTTAAPLVAWVDELKRRSPRRPGSSSSSAEASASTSTCARATRTFSPSATRSVKDFVTGQSLIPLAGPANRQGRIAADVIAGRQSRYRGTQGTSICQIFEGVIGQPFWSRRRVAK